MRWFNHLRPFLAVALGLSLGLVVTKIAGESPLHVLRILFKSAVGSPYDLGMTLYYATPLIFTGLSVAIAFHAGLFNIGAEGQLTLGALAAAVVGSKWPSLPWPFAPVLAGLAAFGVGALWAMIPGWLKAKRGSHEVINTIMLNFVAAGIASYLTLYVFKNQDNQNPETSVIGLGYMLSKVPGFGDVPLNTSLFLALIFAGIVHVLLKYTSVGFEISAVGKNENAAKDQGISTGKIQILAMAIAGGVAALVGVNEVLGSAGKFKLGFSPDYGFIGIAVALLGRNKPWGIVGAAFLFGALHKGAADLDFETENVTRDLSLVLQAMVILCVSADGLWDWFQKSKTLKSKEVV